LVKDSTLFDPAYFNISAQEAPYLDPQQRVMLQLVVEACDRAGKHFACCDGTDVRNPN
jgi:acyl transferase domain-containing protein